jgi:hypothetical protein
MKPRQVYLLLCVVGPVPPYWQFLPWVGIHGLNLRLFLNNCSPIESVRFSAWMSSSPGAGNGARRGVFFGLSLFLYLREGRLEERAEEAAALP